MKKLNRKGFTLIELLAVIVILAIVMVVTIPSVINSMKSARQKQAVNAIHSIEEYVQKNYEICSFGTDLGDNTYDKSIFTTSGNDNCVPKTDDSIITAAGYKPADIESIVGSINGTTKKYTITAATVGKKGSFNDVSGTYDDITFTISTR